ncbi:MAG: surface-adhesin E family protein [Sphingobium sp.]|uniref:surface-adhesin E family protein n=1 Tax=Sphingobium sp. TaxID=1912891 RepID=UPI003BAEB2EF
MFLAVLGAAAFIDFANGWHAISVEDGVVAFYLRSSIAGPHDSRRVTAMTINPQQNQLINSVRFTLRIDCLKRTAQYVDYAAFSNPLKPAVSVTPPFADARPIQPSSIGDRLWSTTCEPVPDELGHFYPIMIDPYLFADQVVRIRRVGIADEFAIILAAIDPKKAPETYETSINSMVPLPKQMQVRSIKEAPDPAL